MESVNIDLRGFYMRKASGKCSRCTEKEAIYCAKSEMSSKRKSDTKMLVVMCC